MNRGSLHHGLRYLHPPWLAPRMVPPSAWSACQNDSRRRAPAPAAGSSEACGRRMSRTRGVLSGARAAAERGAREARPSPAPQRRRSAQEEGWRCCSMRAPSPTGGMDLGPLPPGSPSGEIAVGDVGRRRGGRWHRLSLRSGTGRNGLMRSRIKQARRDEFMTLCAGRLAFEGVFRPPEAVCCGFKDLCGLLRLHLPTCPLCAMHVQPRCVLAG